jgi:hypothetical protein
MPKHHTAENRTTLVPYEAVRQEEIPKGRKGKHSQTVSQLMSSIDQLRSGAALKVPLNALPDSKAHIRAALNRATRRRGMAVSTSSDAEFLYIWKTGGES